MMRPLTRLQRAPRKIAAALIVALLTVLTLEVGVRLLGLAPPVDGQYSDNVSDPVLPFKPRPLSRLTGRSPSDEFAFDYQHNRHGFRDVEHTDHKAAGVYRIVVLGDSFTYGVGAAFSDTYPSQLERLLNERPAPSPRAEVIRLGLGRYFPAAERLVFEHYGVRYEPDLVVLGILPNDIIDTYFGLEGMSLGPLGVLLSPRGQRLGYLGVWLYLHSHLARSLLSRWSVYASKQEPPLQTEDFFRENGPHEATWSAMEADLGAIAQAARDHHAAFAIVSIPHRALWSEENVYLEQRMKRWSAAHGVIFVATLAAFRAAAAIGPPLHWEHDGHCTAAGYTVIAREIFSVLEEQGLAR